ncbi:MAG: HDOD domain-containing protein, partial [Candidatus Muiribacteriota bacterium]
MKILLLEKIKNIKNLNMLPLVVTKLLEVTSNPKSSVKDVSKVVESDFTLSANILKIVNSPFYGFPRKITTINEALVILGFADIRNIALSLTVFDKLSSTGQLDINQFWKHSLGVGVGAKILAEKIKYAKPEEAFICGLIHDIGKIILSEYFQDKFAQIMAVINSNDVYSWEAEESVLDGINHAQIGGWVTEKWKIPQLVTRTVALHHSPMIAGKIDDLAACVNVSDHICKLKGIGYKGDKKQPAIEPHIIEFFGLSGAVVEDIVNKMDKKIAQAEIF